MRVYCIMRAKTASARSRAVIVIVKSPIIRQVCTSVHEAATDEKQEGAPEQGEQEERVRGGRSDTTAKQDGAFSPGGSWDQDGVVHRRAHLCDQEERRQGGESGYRISTGSEKGGLDGGGNQEHYQSLGLRWQHRRSGATSRNNK